MSQRSAATGSLRPSLLVSVLHALRRRSPLPSMTMFSNSGHSSSRIVPASISSAPPIGRTTSYQSDCGEYSFLDGSIEVLREPLEVLQILVVIVPVIRESLLQRFPKADGPVPPTWQRAGKRIFSVKAGGSATMLVCDFFTRTLSQRGCVGTLSSAQHVCQSNGATHAEV